MAYNLFRYCFSYPKLVHILRTVPPHISSKALIPLSLEYRGLIESLVGSSISDSAFIQCTLGVNVGGLGLRNPVEHAYAGYLASINKCAPHVEKLLRRPCLVKKFWNSAEIALNALNALILSQDRIPLAMIKSNTIKQFEISARIDKKDLTKLYSEAPLIDTLRLRSLQDPHSSDWLSVIPNPKLGLSFSPNEFRKALKLRLGVDVVEKSFSCPSCHKIFDCQGIHALNCAGSGDRIRRHNLLRDEFYSKASLAMCSPTCEKAGLIEGTKERPADVLLPKFSRGFDYFLDFAVTNPLSHYMISEHTKTGRDACDIYTDIKLNRYSDKLPNPESVRFQPMVVDAFGKWESSAKEVINTVASRPAARNRTDINTTLRHFYQKLSVVLMKSNTRSVLSRIPMVDFERTKVLPPHSRRLAFSKTIYFHPRPSSSTSHLVPCRPTSTKDTTSLALPSASVVKILGPIAKDNSSVSTNLNAS